MLKTEAAKSLAQGMIHFHLLKSEKQRLASIVGACVVFGILYLYDHLWL